MTKKVLCLDVEFDGVENNPKDINVLSIGITDGEGSNFYVEIGSPKIVDSWVELHVVPHLNQEKITKELASQKLRDYLKSFKELVVIMSDMTPIDWMLFCEILSLTKSENSQTYLPENISYIPIDLCTVLYLKYGDADISRKQLCTDLNVTIDKTRQHHALDDAKQTLALYQAIIKQI